MEEALFDPSLLEQEVKRGASRHTEGLYPGPRGPARKQLTVFAAQLKLPLGGMAALEYIRTPPRLLGHFRCCCFRLLRWNSLDGGC